MTIDLLLCRLHCGRHKLFNRARGKISLFRLPRLSLIQPGKPRADRIFLAGANVPGLLPNVDPDGLLEYSVVYTDRAVNHMSQRFQGVMRDISRTLKQV